MKRHTHRFLLERWLLLEVIHVNVKDGGWRGEAGIDVTQDVGIVLAVALPQHIRLLGHCDGRCVAIKLVAVLISKALHRERWESVLSLRHDHVALVER